MFYQIHHLLLRSDEGDWRNLWGKRRIWRRKGNGQSVQRWVEGQMEKRKEKKKEEERKMRLTY